MKYIISIFFLFLSFAGIKAQEKTILFDLSHSQCRDTYPGYETYPEVLPAYREMAARLGARLVINEDKEITGEILSGVRVLVMLSPLSSKLQKNLSLEEKEALVSFVRDGGSLLLFVDDEHRVNLEQYGANDVTSPFGIEFGKQIPDIPGNCGAVSFENEIFRGRREIPYSGAREMKGGIPVSVCMEGGYLHASYVTTGKGGKLYAAGDTMVGLLLGFPDGKRKESNKMASRWWGKDSRLYMEELLSWALQ